MQKNIIERGEVQMMQVPKNKVPVPQHLIDELNAMGLITTEQMRKAGFNYTADCLQGKHDNDFPTMTK